MKPAIFYSSDQQGIPLRLINKGDSLEALTAYEKRIFKSTQFTREPQSLCLIPDETGGLSQVFVGCAPHKEATALAYAALNLPPGCYKPMQEVSLYALLSWSLAQYRFQRYKNKVSEPRILIVAKENLAAVIRQAEAIFLVRDLINTPANDMGPEALSHIAENIAQQHAALFEECRGETLLKAFPAIHAVGRAASEAPRLIRMEWGQADHPCLVLIGKGVCFDSGGLDIKPSSGMRLMKKDMGGAAHVLGLAQWIMQENLPLHLVVLIPAVENAIGPDAFRPGDIIKMRNGLSVEIDNTDAEGRLILADALSKAGEYNPELIIDFSTLTGAARIAVGTEIAAFFSNCEAVTSQIITAAQQVQDPVWPMPLFEGYAQLLESSVADLSNCAASPYGGAIVAALFLQRFVPDNTRWVHFDIMAWNLSSKPGKPEGGEAMAVRAMMQYLMEKYT